MDANIARAGFNAHGGSAAMHFTDDVVLVIRTLDGHLLIGMDGP
jgi:hypothetical protein